MEYGKVKSVAKQITTKGPGLSKKVLETMRVISDIVGDTLGPGGRQVLIERFEHDMPPMVTKDGVTAFRSLGFPDATMHCIMECARDAAIRTANEAGDGTTTATILAEAIVRFTNEFVTKHPRVSPQKIVRYLEQQFRDVIEPVVLGVKIPDATKKEGFRREGGLTIKIDPTTEAGKKILYNVAKISANGDAPLADVVMKCFEIVGDDGNVTIVEQSGPSSYQAEQLNGYSIPIGYEESCAKFYPMVINDPGTQMCKLDNPVFVLYHGTLNDINVAMKLLSKVGDMFVTSVRGDQAEHIANNPELGFAEELEKLGKVEYTHSNVVFVAVGFSEQVLATLSASFKTEGSIRILPLAVPKSPLMNGQAEFLHDLSAITGATVFDPISRPLDTGHLSDLGPGTKGFESGRFRSNIIGSVAEKGIVWENAIAERAYAIEQQIKNAVSELDGLFLKERLGKLTSGIAKLKVIGASNGELKEKRDRAEDAVCAVRGAIKNGCLPGGGWTLLKLISILEDSEINNEILAPALNEPVKRLWVNAGLSEYEQVKALTPVLQEINNVEPTVYDVENNRHGTPTETGILDSTPAVIEAIRNSISIAALLGTLGGCVCQARDSELERTEARSTQEWLRNVGENPANERA